MSCSVNASRRAASAALFGLESNVGAKLEDACATVVVCGHIGKAHGARGSDVRAVNKTTWSSPVRMVEDVQGLGLEGKPKPLG